MKKHTIILLSIIMLLLSMGGAMTSCKKTSGGTSGTDSGTFLFHLHTQIVDSTIGGNTDGADSNTTGPTNLSPWYNDALGRRIKLTVPQFFICDVVLENANGTSLTLNNIVILKGLDSEDYYICKVPIGTYTSAKFTVGLNATTNQMSPTTLFLTDGIPYPTEASMWAGSNTQGYYGMVVQGAYDTAGTGVNPLLFNFEIPNSLTVATQVSLPTRGTAEYPVYVLTAGGTQYIHVLCDYGQLLAGIVNLKTNNSTVANPLLADSLAVMIPNMFRYEE